MMMWLREPLASDLPPLCAAMRDADAQEIYCLRGHRDPFRLAGEIWRALPCALAAFVAGVDGQPLAAAFAAVWPKDAMRGLGEAALFGTAEFPAIARPLIRHIRRSLIPSLIAAGVRRVECRALATTSHRLIEASGGVRECLLPDMGPDGMDFVQFSWTVSALREHPRGRFAHAG